jgi:hypothetical protein
MLGYIPITSHSSGLDRIPFVESLPLSRVRSTEGLPLTA